MADDARLDDDTLQPRPDETSDTERDRIRSSNDRDQALEREGHQSDHNRGYDEAARGGPRGGSDVRPDIDPDSAVSDVDRDDTLDDR